MEYLVTGLCIGKGFKSLVFGFKNSVNVVLLIMLLITSTVYLSNSTTAKSIQEDVDIIFNVGDIPDNFLHLQNSIYFKLKDYINYITGGLSSRDETAVLTPLLLYYEIKLDEYAVPEFEKLLTLVQTIQQENVNILPSIILTIKCIHTISMYTSVVKYYDKLFLHISNYTSIIKGVSLEYNAFERDMCALQDVKEDLKIISYGINYLLQQNHSSSGTVPLKVGYVVQHDQLSCRAHWENYGQVDYLVINLRLNRPKTFIESYAYFYNYMDNVITTLKNLKTNTRPKFKTAYFIVSLYHFNSARLQGLGVTNEYYQNIFRYQVLETYQNLVVKYAMQWRKDTRSSIIINRVPDLDMLFESTSNKSGSEIIQDIRRLPDAVAPSDENSEVLYRKALYTYFKNMMSSNFGSLYLQRGVLSSFTRNNKMNGSLCNVGICQPNVTLYTEFEQKDIPDKLQTWLGELSISPYIMLFSYHWKKDHDYERKTDYINRIGVSNGLNNMSVGCETRFNLISGSRFNLHASRYTAHVQMANEIISDCELVLNNTNLIIAYSEFNITYSVINFHAMLVLILDEFVIARQMFIQRFPGKNIIFQVRHRLETEDGRRWKDETLYCTSNAAWLWLGYETILTWANINKIPIILRTRKWTWNTPVEWRELKLLPEKVITLSERFPVFIRRSYNQTRMLGNWKGDMFPCIIKSYENMYQQMQFHHEYSGITVNVNARKNSIPLNSNEIQTILCFSLAKFQKIELVNLTIETLGVLFQAVSDTEFPNRLSRNEISSKGKKIYLGVFDFLSDELLEKINDIGIFLKALEIQVPAYTEVYNIDELKSLKNKSNETIQIGIAIKDCVEEANLIMTEIKWAYQQQLEHILNYFDFLVCQTDDQIADNSDNTVMQKYLDAHYYLKTVYHMLFPNLKEVHFRLNPYISTDYNSTSTALHYLADVNNYAKAYRTNFFILQAFPSEQAKNNIITWWNITNYTDLTNTSVYFEHEANYLNATQWAPNMFWNETDGYGRSGNSDTILAWALSGTVVVSVGLLLLTTALAKKIKRNSIILSNDEVKEFLEGKKNDAGFTDSNDLIKTLETSAYKQEYEVDKKFITIEKRKMLGFGQFGVVYKGIISSEEFGGRNQVAVKMPQNGCTKESLLSMLSEVKILCHVGEHINLVRLIGCYTKEVGKGVLWIITELCDGGSLQVYLRQKQAAGCGRDILPDLVRFCKEIACGMEYIAKKKVVHGDLSSRNVLLDSYNICKIGDFGLSRKLYEYQTYVKQNEGPMPWRWMAYESLESMKFSTQSDVWSYGVTVWEIFTLGDMPYPGVNWNAGFIKELLDGTRLSNPYYASEQIYEILLQCWDIDDKKRPSFSDLVAYFSVLLPYSDVL